VWLSEQSVNLSYISLTDFSNTWVRTPAESVRISEQGQEKEHAIHIYTDGSKNEHGVGSGSAIYIQKSKRIPSIFNDESTESFICLVLYLRVTCVCVA
jgi:hypothetical protein